jgi:hypothetical protein
MNFEPNRNVENVCVHQLNHNIDHHLVQVALIKLEEFSKVTRPMDLGPSKERFCKSWFWEFLVNIHSNLYLTRKAIKGPTAAG